MTGLIFLYEKELLGIIGLKDDTVKNYVACIVTFFNFIKERSVDLSSVNEKHLLNFMIYLKKTEIGFSRLNHYRSALQSFFAFIVKIKFISRSPATSMLTIKRKKSELNKPVKNESVHALLDSCNLASFKGLRDFVMISVFWALGIRNNELRTLKIGSFDPTFDRKNKIGLLLVDGKNNKERSLFVVDKLYDNMLIYLSHPEAQKNKKSPMFCTKPNQAISGSQVSRIIKDIGRKQKIKERITPHVLRHTFATDMYHSGVPIDDIRAMLGHSNVAETSLYIHVSDEYKKNALENLSLEERFSWE
ncbi:MAG: tyrosine-type recombinase/integrase [Proteobacteria bacterium]|nr:tyrosine-type recombinase/integrase [Pseudomonadota bacterium]